MFIRPAMQDDLAAIAHLHEANWRRDYAGLLPEAALGSRLSTYMQQRWHPGVLSTSRAFVAHDARDDLIGFAAMLDEGPDGCAYLDNLHVAPVARAQGVGRALMSAVAILAIPGALTLEVLSANRTARRIYRSWGGIEGREFNDTILGEAVPSVIVGWPEATQLVDRLRGLPHG
ncbi:GNAT family N-acetyltransferase [Hasllibacter sp. MH4015]|uniref:GNAT family N-acetyltransferase n=1 Tax=Hasllibacter sp. MH4015 TaxID=2854029 RepID=UPI001CD4C76A|nr:GNAT family N-acetyltransferase [Hasllibacter sp. MH4015]